MNAPAVRLEWMLLKLFCALTGYTEKAVDCKIRKGVWTEGVHYRKTKDGHITMNLQAYYKWVEDDKATA